MSNMAKRGDEKWNHIQIATHRFYYRPGDGLPENGLSTLRASVERGFLNHEFDIAYACEGAIVDHDFSAMRNVGIDQEFAHLAMDDVEGRPILIRKFQNNDFAPSATVSQDVLCSAGTTVREFLRINPDGTFFPDCRNMEIAEYWAGLSHEDHCGAALLMFYTFAFHEGEELAKWVGYFDPHPDWKVRSKFVLNFYSSELITVAKRRKMPAGNVRDLLEVGKKVVESFHNAGVSLFGLVAMCSGLAPSHFEDFEGMSEDDKLAVYAEQAIVELVRWVRADERFPHIKIGSGTRAYDCSIPQPDGTRKYFTYSLMTGKMTPWPTSPAQRRIKELYSTPGICEKVLEPDFIITDEPERAALPCCGIPADDSLGYLHPRFDTVPE